MLKRGRKKHRSSFVKYVTERFHQILIAQFCNGTSLGLHSIQYGTWMSYCPNNLHFNKFSLTKKLESWYTTNQRPTLTQMCPQKLSWTLRIRGRCSSNVCFNIGPDWNRWKTKSIWLCLLRQLFSEALKFSFLSLPDNWYDASIRKWL